jgi:hypothetical protein
MLENGHSFDDEAYQETRQVLNGLLRWSNTLSASTLLAVLYYSRANANSTPCHFPESKNTDVQSQLQEAVGRAFGRTIDYAFCEGTNGLFVRCISVAAKGFRAWARMKDSVQSARNLLISEAFEFGRPSLSLERRGLLR